jgi:hypothetical protein
MLGRESGRPSVAGSMRCPPRKSSSMNFMYASNESVWWSIVPVFAYGEIMRPGTRIPYPASSTRGGAMWS